MGQHVLLIEDEPSIAEAVRFILARDGWRVTCHGDGASAVAAVGRHAPDAVILDVMLPGRSGYDILRDLRADPATADLPVLMLTARGNGDDRMRAAEAGASRFMAKPFSNAAILAEMRALLAGARPARHAAGGA
ncbi:MAG: response regulator transcription factor [Gemmobacter sp.]